MRVFTKKVVSIIAIILSFSLVLSLSAFAATSGQNSSAISLQQLKAAIGDIPSKLPSSSVEIKDKRTEYSSTFLNPDGSLYRTDLHRSDIPIKTRRTINGRTLTIL